MKSYKTRLLSAIALVALVLPALTTGVGADFPQQPGCQTFKETGKTVCGRFMQYWQKNGGLAQQGFPISAEMQEVSETNGKTYATQYFERAVFEYHPEEKPEYQVLLSLLGVFYYNQKYPKGAPNQTANNSPGSMVFKETGKRLGGIFLDYWKKNGALPQQGFPISDEFMEKSDLDGKTYRVQYFERAVFEYHPEEKPQYRVLLSQLGTFRYKARHGAGSGTGIKGEVRYPAGAAQLTIWHSYTGAALSTLQNAIQNISNQNKDFKVTLVAVPADQMQSRFLTAVTAGAGPDLMLGPSEWTGTLAEARSIVPAEGVENINNIIGELQATAVNASRYGGKLYGVPISMNTVALVYNKNIVKTVPTTLEDMIAQAGKLVGGNVKYGLALSADFFHMGGYNFAYGGRLFTNNDPNATNRQVDLTTQGTIDWLTAMKRLKETVGVLAKSSTGGPYWRTSGPSADVSQEIDNLFKNGIAAMAMTGPQSVRDFEKTLGKDKVGVMLAPPIAKGGKFAPFVGTDNYFVSANASTASRMKSVSELLKYITSPGVQQSFVDQVGQLATSIKVDFSASPALALLSEQASQATTTHYDRMYSFASTNLGTFLEQANQGTPEPNVYNAPRLFNLADTMIADVVEGRAAPAEAARRTTESVNRVIVPGPQPTATPGGTGNCASVMKPGIWTGTFNANGTFSYSEDDVQADGTLTGKASIRINVACDGSFTGTYTITENGYRFTITGYPEVISCNATGEEELVNGRVTAGQGGLPRLTFTSNVTRWSGSCSHEAGGEPPNFAGTQSGNEAQATTASENSIGGNSWFTSAQKSYFDELRDNFQGAGWQYQDSASWNLNRQP